MITAIDTSVLLDVLIDDPAHGSTSFDAIQKARLSGALVVCELVVSEICPVLREGEVEQFLADMGIKMLPCSLESALLAGKIFGQYLVRGGKKGRVVSDFLIGAHAQLQAERLLARDRGFFRDYFKKLKVFYPDA